MKTSGRFFRITWASAVVLILSACGFTQAEAPKSDKKGTTTSLRITWEIYSGRESPYFEITSASELQEIESRLKDLPKLPSGKELNQAFGVYILQLPEKVGHGVRIVTVGKKGVEVTAESGHDAYVDAKGLFKYLDELKSKHKLVSGDNFPIEQPRSR